MYYMYMHNTWHELCVYLHMIRSPYGRRDAVTRRCCPYTGRDTASKEPLLRTRSQIGVTTTRSECHSLERNGATNVSSESYF